MTASFLIDALRLPPDGRVDQRVPKTLLIEQGAPTATDKRYIQDGIEELWWHAALKPTNIGVAEYRDDQREYREIVVLGAVLREGAKSPRLMELIHRAIPYPLVLASEQAECLTLSLAHKRNSLGESDKVVVEEVVATESMTAGRLTAIESDFLASLSLTRQPLRNLWTLYQGWMTQIEALAAARITGHFGQSLTPDVADRRRAALAEHARLQRETAMLRTQASREAQINRRVELNLKIQQFEQQLAAVRKQLQPEEA